MRVFLFSKSIRSHTGQMLNDLHSQLPVWHFSVSYPRHRSCDAGGGLVYSVCTSGGMGSQRISGSIFFCKTKKQMGWTQYVVSTVFPATLTSCLTGVALCRLIYQLMEYERFLKAGNNSPTPSERSSTAAEEEEEWGRRRRLLDEAPSDSEECERERDNAKVAQEARALDKAMEDRILARKSSASSVTSSQSGVGMGAAWRSRYGDRKRAGSVASNFTSTGSVLSEDLVEEEEEEDLLGVGGGFDTASSRHRSSSGELESASECDGVPSTLRAVPFTPLTARPMSTPRPPPSAPTFQPSFQLPPVPQSAKNSSFGIPPKPQIGKPKRRPPPLGAVPLPASLPIAPATAQPRPTQPRARTRTESRKPSSPPLYLRNSSQKVPFPVGNQKQTPSGLSTPSQTLFVFPPESAPAARTPSTMTLTSSLNGPVPFPSLAPPRISTSQRHGRTRSFIGLGAPPTPTTAFARVDAKGWIGME